MLKIWSLDCGWPYKSNRSDTLCSMGSMIGSELWDGAVGSGLGVRRRGAQFGCETVEDVELGADELADLCTGTC